MEDLLDPGDPELSEIQEPESAGPDPSGTQESESMDDEGTAQGGGEMTFRPLGVKKAEGTCLACRPRKCAQLQGRSPCG